MLIPGTAGAIPATPLMTVYRFDGPLEIPYYDVHEFLRRGARSPAGSLVQGTSVIPCLAVVNGKVVTDKHGTPFVGFEVVIDARTADRDSTERFAAVNEARKTLRVPDHRCREKVRHVIDVRRLFALGKAPHFDPPRLSEAALTRGGSEAVDEVVRAFHASPHCAAANQRLVGRREALQRAWAAFLADRARDWPAATIEKAMHLDFVMRTALYEGHLDRGCSAYGACERNVVALSIRNRALERCTRSQGCSFVGDFRGTSSKVSQYNIWDEFLTQTTGLTSCFLRPDLASSSIHAKLRAMYEQNLGDVERILFGGDTGLRAVFPDNSLAEVKTLRHYYHPPAMGACFPASERLEYITGAVASRGTELALIANRRVRVDQREPGGYRFRAATIDRGVDRDTVQLSDDYPGFTIDARKIALRAPRRCVPYGTPRGCRFKTVGRLRKTPSWLRRGTPLRLGCRIQSRGEDCSAPARAEASKVGGVCDKEMQPIAGVP